MVSTTVDGFSPSVRTKARSKKKVASVPEASQSEWAEGYSDIEVRMINVDGQLLKVATRTPKGADPSLPPLLMFNGIGANLEVGFPFLSALEKSSSIIFDVPGVGGSPMPKLPYRPRTLARMAKRLIEILGHDKVDVSGVSWGGGLAQQFTYQYPKMVRRLILCATAPGWTMVPGKPSVLSKMGNIKRYTTPGYMREIAAEIYGGDFRGDRELIAPHIKAMKPASNAGYTLQLLGMAGWTSIHWLWRIPQKTLVMAGTDDPLIPVVNAKMLARLIPNAELELIDNGHLFLVTRPEESALRIEEFLKG
ncbi:poly(3-hydroxyalkanoate) depolymerase [Pseudahrensia aquimaris]|uniref:Poly(3-hydroxyalkanoate) depolymerase n=1 Tax=Pseudahrensia aquimaris TaxID=744461 RepID=A0ABW3FHA7_9HYPH